MPWRLWLPSRTDRCEVKIYKTSGNTIFHFRSDFLPGFEISNPMTANNCSSFPVRKRKLFGFLNIINTGFLETPSFCFLFSN